MEQFQSWLPTIFNLLMAAFIYGGLYSRVKNTEGDIVELKKEQTQQWNKMNYTAEKVAALSGKANGHAAGKHH